MSFSQRDRHDHKYGKRFNLDKLAVKVDSVLSTKERVRFCYADAPDGEVPGWILEQAQQVLYYCQAGLKLKEGLRIRWIKSVDSTKPGSRWRQAPLTGEIDGDEIIVRYDIPLQEILITVARLCHSAWFARVFEKDYPPNQGTDFWQATAQSYAENTLRQLEEMEVEAVSASPWKGSNAPVLNGA